MNLCANPHRVNNQRMRAFSCTDFYFAVSRNESLDLKRYTKTCRCLRRHRCGKGGFSVASRRIRDPARDERKLLVRMKLSRGRQRFADCENLPRKGEYRRFQGRLFGRKYYTHRVETFAFATRVGDWLLRE